MKLQQLRFAIAVARHDLNVTAAAEALHTSQPGVSKQIRLLEDELNVKIFERSGKNLTRLTPVGRKILEEAEKALQAAENIRQVAQEDRDDKRGSITLATTHTQARYALPPVVQRFRARYPAVALHIQQGNPKQIASWAARGEVDFCIATEAIEQFDELVMLPCYRWDRTVLVPPGHQLSKLSKLSIQALAQFPLVTYTFGFTGRSQLDAAFSQAGLTADVVLTAVDADVIKTYVRLGLGIGIVANMAYDPKIDHDLIALDAGHLFETSTTRVGLRRDSYLRRYSYDFIQLFAAHLKPDVVNRIVYARSSEDARRQIAELDSALPRL